MDGGEILALASTGYEAYPQRDGSIQFAFELPRGVEVEQGTRYAIRLWVNNCEVSPEGELDEETYQGEAWTIEIEPTRKEAQ